jgi:hypothetical protein
LNALLPKAASDLRDIAETLPTRATDPPVSVRSGTAGNRDWDGRGLVGRLPESISEAITRTAATGAVAALLSERSPAVREATLDELIARAAAQTGSSTHATTAAQDLAAVGCLDEAALLRTAQRGEARLCAAILAHAAGTRPPPSIAR